MTRTGVRIVNADEIKARYENPDVAGIYDWARFQGVRGRYNNWRTHRILKSVMKSLPAPDVVLDVPCGTGRLFHYLTRSSRRVIAADISTEMLKVAQAKAHRLRTPPALLRVDARHLPFRTDSIDVTFGIRFLHLLDREARLAVLRELARITRGTVIVEYRSVTKLSRVARRTVLRWMGKRNLRRRTTVAELVEELRQCGLAAGRHHFINRWVSASVIIAARPEPIEDLAAWPARERALEAPSVP